VYIEQKSKRPSNTGLKGRKEHEKLFLIIRFFSLNFIQFEEDSEAKKRGKIHEIQQNIGLK
jgi:hypothetical protein